MIPEIPETVRNFPLELARNSVEHFLTWKKILPVPKEIPLVFQEKAGVFVSIRNEGELRGCIGTIFPETSSIAEEIIRNAVSAATRDPRFPPVIPSELPHLAYSVDVLGKPEAVSLLSELNPKVYGVIVRSQGRCGLLLPDLEGIDTALEQVNIARGKGRILPAESITLERFTVKRYGEK